MTRNNRDRSKELHTSSTISIADSLLDLPDLSTFGDEEKQHILNVLERDENLRNEHLSRFLNLRKEVADLQEQSQAASTSVCARCQTPFGYIFNTGDICPKCGAKVCKQCRLMYNVHDNGWLCQLCCKQMQLMSYSGEWLYSPQGNLRKYSTLSPQTQYESSPRSVSARNSDIVSSSDSEPEDLDETPSRINRFDSQILPVKPVKPKQSNVNNKRSNMIVQSEIDEQKLTYIKNHIKRRPMNISQIQPLPKRIQELLAITNGTNTSSDQSKSLSSQSPSRREQTSNKPNPPILKDIEVVKPRVNENHTIQPTSEEIEQKVVAPPPAAKSISQDKKTKREKLRRKTSRQSSPEGSKLSLQTNTTAKSSKKHLSTSMQNLRDTVHRISPSHLLSSHTSLHLEKKRQSVVSSNSTINDADAISIKVSDTSNILNISTKSETLQSSTDDSKQTSKVNHQESTDIPVSTKILESKPEQNRVSTTLSATTTNEYNRDSRSTSVEKYGRTRTSRTASVGNRTSIADSDDDIQSTTGQKKLGSQVSLNSGLSDSKAGYELDITGTIELKLSYNTKLGSLDILIQKCTNLARAKRNQTSNPYCKLYLLPDQSKTSKLKTMAKRHTTDPVFGETLRYQVGNREFDSRIIWISVWSQSTLGHNDFLGEIHIPLANCTLDEMKEYTLLPRIQKDDVASTIEVTSNSSELIFDLTFIENPKNKELGTLQVSAIQGKGIYHGKHNVDAICKGQLLPDKVKRKLPTMPKGPSPKWDIPLQWENIRRKNLKNTSVEISIWSQERFRKTMIGLIRLSPSSEQSDAKSVKGVDTTNAEKSVWDLFVKDPTKTHRCQLPLRPAAHEK